MNCRIIYNQEITIDELIQIIKAPDFPTGGTIYGYDGLKKLSWPAEVEWSLENANIEIVNDRECIEVTEILINNKAEMIRKPPSWSAIAQRIVI